MRLGKAPLVIPVLLTLLPTLAFAVQPDRITGAIDSSQVTTLPGNVHGLARPEFNLGRTDGSKLLSGVSLVFKPSVSQQKALDKLLADQQNPASPSYHKWLTPAQFADRFGMTRNDIEKVISWLESQGFTVTRLANSRNQVFFEGTVAQVEAAFHTEIHDYLVDGEVHFANATEPSVPSALAGSALAIQNLHNFHPKPRLHPYFTSYVSGNHFISPSDFATIYNVNGLYTGGVDGTGQKIAITGQSNINLTDVANYRSAAGLAANAPTLTLVPGTGASTVCSGDEGESDLDVEFSGGVAKNASVTLVYAGIGTGTTCGNRTAGAFDALQYAVDQNIAPIISNSYGNCESAIGSAFATTMQGWAQQANIQGQTIISASGDSGAADCDFHVASATKGFAVDLPAAIPEVTGAGGTEFSADSPTCTTDCPPGGDPPYWAAAGATTDTLSSALEYIPETAWNDTAFDIAHGGFISASGGGASIFFSKPTWQTGTGVPSDGKRDVPDISVSASADHDGYLFCSEDGANGTKVTTCTSGFRDGAGGSLAVVGGTSAAAPTLAGVMALINQFLGNTPPGGLGNINPNLYQLAASTPTAFNDVATGNNVVPCTKGTANCSSGSFGFSAGVGYDQVTGLGSVNAFKLAQAWLPTQASTTTTLNSSTSQIVVTQKVTFTSTVTPSGAFPGYVNFYNGTTLLGSAALDSAGNASFSTTSLPGGTDTITAVYAGSGSFHTSTSSPLSMTVTVPTFTLTPSATTLSLQPGQSTGNTVQLTVASTDGFVTGGNQTVLPLNYSCTVSPVASEGPTCAFSPSSGQGVTVTNPTVAIETVAPVAKFHPLLERHSSFFYAMLLPGMLGIVLAASGVNEKRPRPRALRVLGLIVVLSFSTLWLGACGGSNNSQKNPGTPPGNYTVTVSATTTGSTTIKNSTTFTVTVQ